MQTREISSTELTRNDKDRATRTISRRRLWGGWIISSLAGLLLLSSGVNMARKAPFVMQSFPHLGYGEHLAFGIGIVEFACAALYLFPHTAFLGAVLTTGYLGGAVATHVRVGDFFLGPVIVGVFVWLGLVLRDRNLSDYVFRSLGLKRKGQN